VGWEAGVGCEMVLGSLVGAGGLGRFWGLREESRVWCLIVPVNRLNRLLFLSPTNIWSVKFYFCIQSILCCV
jgi:hypothetical protein